MLMLLKISPSNQHQRGRRNSISFHQEASSRFRGSLFLSVLLVISTAIAGWIGQRAIKTYFTHPQAMLVLGGDKNREIFAAKFARQYPHLQIWVSSGSNREYSEWVFSQAGINLGRVHLDSRAQDTVTNFTTLVDEFHQQGITSIYLVTSDDHMRRACVIGEIVLGSRGITFKPMSVPSKRSPEPLEKSIRDGVRAILWITTGHTGASLGIGR